MKMKSSMIVLCAGACFWVMGLAHAFNGYMDQVNTMCGTVAVEGCASCHEGGTCSEDPSQCSLNQIAYLTNNICSTFCPDSDVCPNGVTPTPSEEEMLAEARAAVGDFGAELMSKFQQAMQQGGPVHAINVCPEIAPAIASRVSRETGWMVRRVTQRERNPLAIPDEWELDALRDFEKALAKGASPAELEKSQVRNEEDRQYFRYIKAITIPAGMPCLACHGDYQALDPAIRTELFELYPHDKATGYSTGDIRGAFSVKRRID